MTKLMRFFYRKPDFVIHREGMQPYLQRWWVIPRNKYFNIYLHKFLMDDEDRALHDHPWWSMSIVLKGGYIEHLVGGVIKKRKAPSLIFRKATHAHRVELYRDFVGSHVKYQVARPAWTIFITGPKIREWGFLCPKGWRHYRQFVSAEDQGKIGKGCND